MLLFYAAMTEDLLQAFHTKVAHLLTPPNLAGGVDLALGPTIYVKLATAGLGLKIEGLETEKRKLASHISLEKTRSGHFSIQINRKMGLIALLDAGERGDIWNVVYKVMTVFEREARKYIGLLLDRIGILVSCPLSNIATSQRFPPHGTSSKQNMSYFGGIMGSVTKFSYLGPK
jgi:hypothetical protein